MRSKVTQSLMVCESHLLVVEVLFASENGQRRSFVVAEAVKRVGARSVDRHSIEKLPRTSAADPAGELALRTRTDVHGNATALLALDGHSS